MANTWRDDRSISSSSSCNSPGDAYGHGFIGGCPTHLVDVIQGNKAIGLRVVSAHGSLGNLVGHCDHAGQPALLSLTESRHNIQLVALFYASLREVLLVHEQHIAATENATVTIIQPIDGRVVLVVAAERGELEDGGVCQCRILSQPDKPQELSLARRCIPHALGRRQR